MKFKRIFLIVLDSLGVGEAMDAETYNDKGANTLGHIVDKTDLFIPNFKKIGLLNTLNMNNLESNAYYTIARPKNRGKDSLSGHYELMGIENLIPYKMFNNQPFPRDMLETIAATLQKPLIGNIIGSDKEVIERLMKRQIETGSLIIYTTGDSNLEVAANEDIISLNKLYEYCEKIRKFTDKEEWKIGKIIAKPFKIVDNKCLLTEDTKSFTLNPPNRSVLDILKKANLQTISIGKINDLYNGIGITKIINAYSNNEGISKLMDIMDKNFKGLCFVNLNDFDHFGHERNIDNYKKAIEEFDVEIPLIINKLNIDDMLIITADHGCDPTMPNFNHTRENIPVLVYSRAFTEPKQLDILNTFADVGATITDIFGLDKPWIGKSFKDKLI